MKFKVFISYSTKDLQKAEKVREILESNENISVFIAEYSVKPGEKLTKRIKDEIRNCHLFILLWSNHSKSSDWVSQEIGIAQEGDKIIIPVLID